MVMALAYHHDDPELTRQLENITRLDNHEFDPKNCTGPVAPMHVYSMRTAVLLKRHYCGAHKGGDGNATVPKALSKRKTMAPQGDVPLNEDDMFGGVE
jgi:hypothetical protein